MDATQTVLPVKVGIIATALFTEVIDQQSFTVSKVAADWHELMVPQCIVQPSIAYTTGQLELML